MTTALETAIAVVDNASNVKELRQLAKDMGLTGYTRLKRDDLKAAIVAAIKVEHEQPQQEQEQAKAKPKATPAEKAKAALDSVGVADSLSWSIGVVFRAPGNRQWFKVVAAKESGKYGHFQAQQWDKETNSPRGAGTVYACNNKALVTAIYQEAKQAIPA